MLQLLPQTCGPSTTGETAEVIAVIMAAGLHPSQHEMSLSCPALAITPIIWIIFLHKHTHTVGFLSLTPAEGVARELYAPVHEGEAVSR